MNSEIKAALEQEWNRDRYQSHVRAITSKTAIKQELLDALRMRQLELRGEAAKARQGKSILDRMIEVSGVTPPANVIEQRHVKEAIRQLTADNSFMRLGFSELTVSAQIKKLRAELVEAVTADNPEREKWVVEQARSRVLNGVLTPGAPAAKPSQESVDALQLRRKERIDNYVSSIASNGFSNWMTSAAYVVECEEGIRKTEDQHASVFAQQQRAGEGPVKMAAVDRELKNRYQQLAEAQATEVRAVASPDLKAVAAIEARSDVYREAVDEIGLNAASIEVNTSAIMWVDADRADLKQLSGGDRYEDAIASILSNARSIDSYLRQMNHRHPDVIPEDWNRTATTEEQVPAPTDPRDIDVISRAILEGEWTSLQMVQLRENESIMAQSKKNMIDALQARLEKISEHQTKERSLLVRIGVALGVVKSPEVSQARNIKQAIQLLQTSNYGEADRADLRSIEEGKKNIGVSTLPSREDYVQEQAAGRLKNGYILPAAMPVALSALDREYLKKDQAEGIARAVERIVDNYQEANRVEDLLDVVSQGVIMDRLIYLRNAEQEEQERLGDLGPSFNANASKRAASSLEHWEKELPRILSGQRRPLSGSEFKEVVHAIEATVWETDAERYKAYGLVGVLAKVHGPSGEWLFRDGNIRSVYRQGLDAPSQVSRVESTAAANHDRTHIPRSPRPRA